MSQRRSRVVKVRLTDDERDRLVSLAATRDWSVPRLLLESVEAAADLEGLSTRRDAIVELREVRRLLANTANNVNQIAAAVNSGQPLVSAQLASELAWLYRMMDQCTGAVKAAAR